MALQPGETWHPELNLSRADVKFHYDEHGALYAVLMMRPCKNGKYMRGKTVPIVLAGGVSTNHPTNQPDRLQRCGPYAGARRAGRFAAVVYGPPRACRRTEGGEGRGARRGRGGFPGPS